MAGKIAGFLAKFTDQRLADLQCAAEDGTLVYEDNCACLLHYQHGNYEETKWLGPEAISAREAELEFLFLGPGLPKDERNAFRRKVILALISDEWECRTAKREEAARQEALCAC